MGRSNKCLDELKADIRALRAQDVDGALRVAHLVNELKVEIRELKVEIRELKVEIREADLVRVGNLVDELKADIRALRDARYVPRALSSSPVETAPSSPAQLTDDDIPF